MLAYLGPSANAEAVLQAVEADTVVEVVEDETMPDDQFFKARYQGRSVYFPSAAAVVTGWPSSEPAVFTKSEWSQLRHSLRRVATGLVGLGMIGLGLFLLYLGID